MRPTSSFVLGTFRAIFAPPNISHCWKANCCFLLYFVKMPATPCPHCAAILPFPIFSSSFTQSTCRHTCLHLVRWQAQRQPRRAMPSARYWE